MCAGRCVAALPNYPRSAGANPRRAGGEERESLVAQTPRLEVGDKAPAFSLPDADGNTVTLADYRGRKVIVYFYPAASTPGCTKQACDFRDNLARAQRRRARRRRHLPRQAGEARQVPRRRGADLSAAVRPRPQGADGVGRLRREEDVRQDRAGRHPLDVRRRREGQDRGRAVQRQGHRPRRQAAPRPIGLNARFASSSASAVAARSSTPRCRLSLMLCACVARVFHAGDQDLGRRERRRRTRR